MGASSDERFVAVARTTVESRAAAHPGRTTHHRPVSTCSL